MHLNKLFWSVICGSNPNNTGTCTQYVAGIRAAVCPLSSDVASQDPAATFVCHILGYVSQ